MGQDLIGGGRAFLAFAAVLGFLGGGRWPFLVLILPLVLPFWQVFRRRIWGLVWTFGSTFGTCLDMSGCPV